MVRLKPLCFSSEQPASIITSAANRNLGCFNKECVGAVFNLNHDNISLANLLTFMQ
jgi:hypothetical protein